MPDAPVNPLELAVPHARGWDSYETKEPMPKGLSESGAWAWDLGYRLHQHLRLNGFIEAAKPKATN